MRKETVNPKANVFLKDVCKEDLNDKYRFVPYRFQSDSFLRYDDRRNK